jgi:hypothetical protein
MVEIFHAFHLVKGFFIMTLPAILPELIFVNVGMTAGAIIKRYSFEFLHLHAVNGFHLMAPGTFNFTVFS